MIDTLGDILKSILVGFLWWILLFPVVLVTVTPIILVVSVFAKPATTYASRVEENYRNVKHFWTEWGILFVP